MKVTFRQSFARDLKKVKTQAVLDRVRRAIEQVEATSTTQEVRDLKKMSGAATSAVSAWGTTGLAWSWKGAKSSSCAALPRRDLYRFFP